MLTQTQRAHKAACSPGFSAAEARLRERTAEIERQTLARLEVCELWLSGPDDAVPLTTHPTHTHAILSARNQ